MKKKFISHLITGLLSIFLLAGCGSASNETAKISQDKTEYVEKETSNEVKDNPAVSTKVADDKPISFTIGVLNKQLPSMVDDYYGFTETELGEGVLVERQNFSAGSDAITALVNGDVDVVFGLGSLPVISTSANGFEYNLISYYSTSGGMLLVAGNESGITDLNGLKGHSIGVTFGTAGHMELLSQLKSVGLTEDDVALVNADAESEKAALVSGDIDAALLLNVHAASIIATGDASVISASGEGPVWIAANKDYAEANPNIISGYLSALNKAGKYIEENEDKVVREVAPAYDMEESVLQSLVDTLVAHDFLSIGDEYSVEQLERTYQFLQDQDLIEGKVDINKIINKSYAENVTK
ncbi:MAG: ABC transporter substrate-binding protein [Lachnospiraceae bacterium]